LSNRMSILQKIADIEAEMARTQKNKATSGHLGLLKAKLAKLRREIIEPKSLVVVVKEKVSMLLELVMRVSDSLDFLLWGRVHCFPI